jgi:hypothetical protein
MGDPNRTFSIHFAPMAAADIETAAPEPEALTARLHQLGSEARAFAESLHEHVLAFAKAVAADARVGNIAVSLTGHFNPGNVNHDNYAAHQVTLSVHQTDSQQQPMSVHQTDSQQQPTRPAPADASESPAPGDQTEATS